jgi:hypothetical protein
MDIHELGTYIKTTNDSAVLQNILQQLCDGLYRTDTSAVESMRKALPYEQAVLINRLMTQSGIGTEDKAGMQNFFIKLQETLLALPVIQITLAVSPNTQLVNRMHEWFYRTYHKLVLLEIIINPDIVAGSIVSANGKYYDYSLKKKTQQFFAVTQ